MVEKYFQGAVPDKGILNEQGRKIEDKRKILFQEVAAPLSAGFGSDFSLALSKIWGLINMANKYIEDTKPWNLAKENRTDELKSFIRILVDVIREVADRISPFMPKTGEDILEQIGRDKIKKGKPLFPRIDNSKPNA